MSELRVDDNLLAELNLSQNIGMKYLSCDNNQLKALDISQCSALENLFCSDNQLAEIDLSQSGNLEYLDCGNNLLKILDVSGCSKLATLYCYGNYIKSEDDVTGRSDKLFNFNFGWQNSGSIDDDTENITESFTDPNFQTAVRDVLGLESGADITRSACAEIKELNVSGKSIEELAGIEYLTGLESLDCSGNPLVSLDVSNRIKLKKLRTDNCADLEYLSCNNNRLTELNIDGCNKLITLVCRSNRLKELNIPQSSGLTRLDCSSNMLTALEVSQFQNMQSLNCSSNRLQELNIPKSSVLTELDCGSNRLTALDVSCYTELKRLSCRSNRLTELDITKCTKLEELDYSLGEDGNTLLSGILDMSQCPELTSLICDGAQLTKLDISKCPKLTQLYCRSNSLETLDVSNCTELTELRFSSNQIENIDLSRCESLKILDCGPNKLTELNLSGCGNLEILWCGNNQLKTLEIRNCSKLKRLYCQRNQLTGLDISGCPELAELGCYYNNMKSQDDVKGRGSSLTNFQFDPQNNSTPESPTPPVQTPTPEPTPSVTPVPTDVPTQTPTPEPTTSITPEPTQTPTPEPTDTPTQEPKKAQKLNVKPGSLELYVGGTAKNLKVSNAKGEVTYKSSAPEIVKVGNKGKVTPMSKGEAYITVRAAGDNEYEASSKKINVTVYGKPAKVKGVKAAPAKAKRTLKVSWKEVPSVSGYIIKYSYNNNMKNSETIRVNKGSSTSKTLKRLTSKKYVYIQVQAYKKDGSAFIKGAWSAKTKSSGRIK